MATSLKPRAVLKIPKGILPKYNVLTILKVRVVAVLRKVYVR